MAASEMVKSTNDAAWGSGHSIDIDPIEVWLSSKNNGTASTNTSQGHKIQEVPFTLRKMESNKGCYDPSVVSIGPFHHGKTELERAERLKFSLARVYAGGSGLSALQLYNKVAEVREEARSSYAEGLTERFSDEAFTNMMFLDGCFVLQFVDSILNDKCSELNIKSHDVSFIQRDLFLLENQVPFRVLEVLMKDDRVKLDEMIKAFIDATRTIPYERGSCLELLERLLNMFGGRSKSSPVTKNKPVTRNQLQPRPAHLLEMMWRQLVNIEEYKAAVEQGQTIARAHQQWHTYRSVQELKAAGIHFRPSKSHFFTNVRYQPVLVRAILLLPPMTVDDATKSLLLNLVAYEACPDCPADSQVTSYLCFLDSLIDSAEDVKELRKKRIILNFLGSDEQVSNLFNEIANDLVPNTKAYMNVKSRIEQHYKNRVRVWIAEWLHTHFSTPWTILAFFGATVGLILTAIQTYKGFFPKDK